MIRIRTKIGEDYVHTLQYGGKWITIYSLNGKRDSTDTPTFFEAGQMHLQMCKSIVKSQQEKS
jgi:hypothetical protein